jgi:hypothetical protein
MAKLDESEGEVLSRDEMKSTKGGLGAAAAASQAAFQEGLSAADFKGLAAGALDTGIEAETLNIPSQQPIGVNAPPNVPLPPKR